MSRQPLQQEADDVAMEEVVGGGSPVPAPGLVAAAAAEVQSLAQELKEEAPQPAVAGAAEEKKAPPRRNRGLYPAPIRRRLPGGEVEEVPREGGSEEKDLFEPLRKYPAKLRQLKQRATTLLDQVRVLPSDADAQALYAKYQETKQQLVTQIQKIVDLEQKIDQFQLNAEGNVSVNAEDLQEFQMGLDEDFQQLEQVVETLEEQLGKQVEDARRLRTQFEIQGDLQTQADFDNYYGVYFYNVLVNACKQVLQKKNMLPPPLPGLYAPQQLFVAIINAEVVQEITKQTTYLRNITDLINNIQQKGLQNDYKTQLDQWETEKTAVEERLEPNNGTLQKCRTLAFQSVQNNRPLQIEAQKQVARWQPIDRTKILTGIVGSRMFENDIMQNDQKVEFDERVGPQEQKAMMALWKKDIQWRQLPLPEKERFLQLASTWADEGKVEPVDANALQQKLFLRLLQGVLSHLGLVIYEPGDAKLAEVAQTWNSAAMLAAMKLSCKSSDEKEKTQKVIRIDPWKKIYSSLKGENMEENYNPGGKIYVMLDQATGQKFFGLLQTRNAQDHDDLRQILSRVEVTPNANANNGIPDFNFAQTCMEMTFLCTQRTAGNENRYLIRGKDPRQLGVLIMLWAFVQQAGKFDNTILEVVGTLPGSAMGFSSGPANTQVAAFYQKYFKYQRASPLSTFATDKALAYFHPNWEGYQLRASAEETMHQPMLRPYPTWPDLADVLARLVRDVQEYYR